MGKTDDLIRSVIAKAKKPISTYEIAKLAGISWGTTTTHCYKLASEGVLACKQEESKTGAKKVLWWLKK